MSLQSHLSDLTGKAFAEIGLSSDYGEVVPAQRPELAQFQCNGAMAAAKKAGKPPREIAAAVADRLAQAPEVASADIAGPGFINIRLTDETLVEWANMSA